MSRLDYTKSKEQIKKEKYVKLILVFLLLIVMLIIGVVGALKDNFNADESPPIEEKPVVAKNATTTEEPKPTLKSLGIFKCTAYCPCVKCCGKDDGITASGTKATQGRTIAADLPFGTEVFIDGHKYVVEDRGGVIRGNCIDIYFENHIDAINFGVQYKEVYTS